ncbi:hypothetical protein SBBP2_1900004 [Burkholderiales bacterium]|nr:hypothetical protein SBBP2_1900004 [Burkholderiales bacterium]
MLGSRDRRDVGWSKSPSAGSLVQEQLHSVAFCYGIVSKSCLQANNPTLPSRGQGRREIQPEIARATGLDRKTIPLAPPTDGGRFPRAGQRENAVHCLASYISLVGCSAIILYVRSRTDGSGSLMVESPLRRLHLISGRGKISNHCVRVVSKNGSRARWRLIAPGNSRSTVVASVSRP